MDGVNDLFKGQRRKSEYDELEKMHMKQKKNVKRKKMRRELKENARNRGKKASI